MNEVDKNNYNYLRKLINEKWGFHKSSLDWVNSVFDDPSKREIDPIYKKVIGEDLRARWPLKDMVYSGKDKKDKGWIFFELLFGYVISSKEITYQEYASGLKQVGKQKMKLNKIISDYYLKSHRGNFYNDLLRSVSLSIEIFEKMQGKLGQFGDRKQIEALKNTSLGGSLSDAIFEDLVSKYIIAANELIGKYKSPADINSYELVMSLNWVDWFLCSTGEEWSSCWNIDGDSGYWTGIPFLFDDRNRAMFYVTNTKASGRKKYREFEVDHFLTRSWALLNNNDRIHMVRWFPNGSASPKFMSQITSLQIAEDSTDFGQSKYPVLEKMRFEDGKGILVPFLDAIGIDYKNEKNYTYSSVRGVTGAFSNIPEMFYRNRGVHLFDLKCSLYERIHIDVCNNCGQKMIKNGPEVVKFRLDGMPGEICVCKKCFKEIYDSCEICGNRIEKKNLIKIGKTEKVCLNCKETHFKECSICKVIEKNDDIKGNFCKTCLETSEKVIFCQLCNDPHSIAELGLGAIKKITFEDGEVAFFCNDDCKKGYEDLIKLNIDNEIHRVKECSICHQFFHDNLLFIDHGNCEKPAKKEESVYQEFMKKNICITKMDYKETYSCKECCKKISERSVYQLSFPFMEKKKKKIGLVA